MKPNTIELDEKGIFCYEAPEKPSKYLRVYDEYQIALKQAKRDKVYFKPDDRLVRDMLWDYYFKFLNKEKLTTTEQGKQYPIPDGYEVKIEGGYSNPEWNEFYAILVPKEKSLWPKMEKINEGKRKQPSIEEAAQLEFPDGCDNTNRSAEVYRRVFIAGAKWMQEQLKQEKL